VRPLFVRLLVSGSNLSAPCQRHAIAVSDNKMVKQPDVDKIQRIAYPAGDESVRLAGLGNSRRVIMGKYYCGSVAVQRLFDHFSRINRRGIDRPPKQFVECQHAMPVVQEHTTEDFVWPVP